MTVGKPFAPGQSGNKSGRPKFSKNKFRFDVAEILKEHKCNPFQILADIAMDETKSIHARTSAAAELCSYVAPKLKQIEHKGDAESPLQITLHMSPR